MSGALPRLHAITDERIARRPDVAQVAAALAAGAPGLALHARGHALTGLEHHTLAVLLSQPPGQPATEPTSRLFVNDRLDIALAVGAHGVQLGRGSLSVSDARPLNPDWIVGRSVHSLAEAAAAAAEKPDYLLVGPVFATATHPDTEPLGVDVLREIAALGLPVIAIGGMTFDRVAAVRAAGASGVAAIRALWDAPDPEAAARAFATELER